MSPAKKTIKKIRSLLRHGSLDGELDDEVRFHLETKTRNYIAAGMSPGEAREAALRDFGRVEQTKEECRDMRGTQWIENFWQDLHYSVRMLAKDRKFTILAVLALALGIGLATVVFSVFYNLMFHPFSARDADRLVVASVRYPDEGPDDPGFDWYIPDFLSYQADNHTFEDMVGSSLTEVLYSNGKETRQISGAYVSANAFEFYGVPALMGRGLVPRDGLPGSAPAFAISYELWKNVFDGDPDALGRTFRLNDTLRTLVGIMPPRFRAYGIMPLGSQSSGIGIWLPLTVAPGVTRTAVGPDGSRTYLIHIVGRLKPGMSPRAAEADLNGIMHRLEEAEFPAKDQPYLEQFSTQVQWEADYLMGSFRRILYALLGAVLILLLIACSNVANLLLARATAREREIAVRSALGASRGRLVRQMLSESFVLAAAACAVGCAFGYFGLKAAMVVIPQTKISSESVIGLNSAVLLFALGLTLVTTLLCGLAPAFHATRSDLRSRLAGSGKGSEGSFRHGNLRAALVVLEVALSIALLAGAGLMMRTFYAVTHADLGFNPKDVLVVELHVPAQLYDTAEKENALYQQILRRVTSVPGITSAAVDSSLRLSSGANTEISFPGKVSSGRLHNVMDLCSEGLFRTLGLHLMRGRLLSKDDVDSARHVVVINEAIAKQWDNKEDPIGRTFQMPDPGHSGGDAPRVSTFEVVGIVADSPNRGVQYPAAPEIYMPYTIAGVADSVLMVRSSVAADSLVPAISREIWMIDPSVSVNSAGLLEKYLYQSSYAQPEFGLSTLSALAGTALVLIVIGIFSVMAYTVSLQTHEIGVRMALGAQQSDVLSMVIEKGVMLVGTGLVIGVLASLGLTRLIRSQLWGVSATDPWTFTAVIVIVIAAGIIACLVPARRATRVDPLIALRYE